MFTGSIKISELDGLGLVLGRDFFPVVQSGSLTTFRVSITTLNEYFRISGSALSASWSSHSLDSDRATSASFASASLTSLQTISASWASHSLNADRATSASFASASISASFSNVAISASFAPFNQSFQASASWASQSLSSSYALSASYSPILGDTVPIGTIMAFGSSTVPNNWLECNGDAKLTASFSDLFSALQTTDLSASFGFVCDQFGNRNTSSFYFKIPDFRGEFLRGWDHNRGIDIGRAIKSSQTQFVGAHYHGVGAFSNGGDDDAYFILRSWNDGVTYAARGVFGNANSNVPTTLNNPSFALGTTDPINGISGAGRPRNVAVMWCIKYSNATNFAVAGTATISGDVVGTLAASNVIKIQNTPVTSSAPTDGDVLRYTSGSNMWYPTPITALAGNPGRSLQIANPSGFFADGTNFYIANWNRHTNRRNLVHVDANTNVATYLFQWPEDAFSWYGRIFRKTTDNQLHIITFSTVDLYDYDIDGNIITRITGSGGNYLDLPVKVSWASGSLRPTVWALYGSYNAGTNGDTPIFRWRKHYWNGSIWVSTFASNDVDLQSINNNTELMKFYNQSTNPGTATSTLMWDYNYIKKRYYLVDTGTGYMHILQQDVGDIDTHWNNIYISYVKTLAIPLPHMDDWSNPDTEKMVVDYDPDTGDERGICMNRRGDTNLLGNISYIYWPE